MKSNGERILIRRGMGITLEVEKVLRKEFGVRWFKPSEEDELRLLRLDQWREKYHVTLEWMLLQLIPYWRKKYNKFGNGTGIGVSIPALTGDVSEKIIVSRIKEQFPDGQLFLSWRVGMQEQQWSVIWDRGRQKEDWGHPQTALRQYRNRVGEERVERGQWRERLRKRRYRGNPWL